MNRDGDIERRLVGLLLACVAGLAMTGAGACDFQQPVCVSDSECRSGFVCSSSSGYCEPNWNELRQPDAGEDAEDDEETRVEDTGPPDVEDTRSEDEEQEDTPFIPSACVGERTDDGCDPGGEPNDAVGSAYPLSSSPFGCRGDDFRTLDKSIGAGICGDDRADFYELEFVECRSRAYEIDIRVQPRAQECPHDVYGVYAIIGSEEFHCTPDRESFGSDARCTLVSGGGRQLKLEIRKRPAPSTRFVTIVVRSYAESGSAYINYDMRVRLE